MSESAPVPPRRILLVVERDKALAGEISRSLGELFSVVDVAHSAAAGLEAAKALRPDLLLLEHAPPGLKAGEFLSAFSAAGFQLPALIVTALPADELGAAELAALGAREHLVKDKAFLARLPLAVGRALRLLETERALKAERARFDDLVNLAPDPVYVSGPDRKLIYFNPEAVNAFGPPDGRLCYEHIYGQAGPCSWCRRLSASCAWCTPRKAGAGTAFKAEFYSAKAGRHYEVTEIPFPGEDGRISILGVMRDITGTKKSEEALNRSLARLEEQKRQLERKDAALQEVIRSVEAEKESVRGNVLDALEKFLALSLKRLKSSGASPKCLELMEKTLSSLTSSFGRKPGDRSHHLSPREMEICGMIREGLTTKEISGRLKISSLTVSEQRKHIRRKLGLANTSTNLTAYLRGL